MLPDLTFMAFRFGRVGDMHELDPSVASLQFFPPEPYGFHVSFYSFWINAIKNFDRDVNDHVLWSNFSSDEHQMSSCHMILSFSDFSGRGHRVVLNRSK